MATAAANASSAAGDCTNSRRANDVNNVLIPIKSTGSATGSIEAHKGGKAPSGKGSYSFIPGSSRIGMGMKRSKATLTVSPTIATGAATRAPEIGSQ